MKEKLLVPILALLLVVGIAAAGPVINVPLIGGQGSNPIYTEMKFAPLVFLNSEGGRVLFDDPFGVIPENNGDITDRDNNYAFTGEQIQWRVLVWDKNGVPEKIEDVFAGWVAQTNGPLDPDIQVNCELDTLCQDGDLLVGESVLRRCDGYSNVRRPGDQEPQQYFNAATMAEYVCTLTVEPSCTGQKWFGVMAVDIDDLNGTMQEAESWFCNPTLDLSVSGGINFGVLGPGEQGAATFSVQNNPQANSGVEVVLSIAGTDFYDPTSSGGKCPTSNVFNLKGVDDPDTFTTGFWYTAVMGANTQGNIRIPYGTTISESLPLFGQDWNNVIAMSPGSEATVTLHMGIPQPCNGQYTDGSIDLWAWAI